MNFIKSFFIWMARFTAFFAVIGIITCFVIWAINAMGLSELGSVAFMVIFMIVGGAMVAAYFD